MSNQAAWHCVCHNDMENGSISVDFTFSDTDEVLMTASDSQNYLNSYCQQNGISLNNGQMLPVYPLDMNNVTNSQLHQMFQCNGMNYEQVPIAKQNIAPNLQLFKTIECGIKTYHDHKQCPFFHTPKDRRRNTSVYTYEPDICPNNNKETMTCIKGDRCAFSQNTVEQFYHPKKYKTKLCTHYPSNLKECIYGKFCSFAHKEDELRIKLLHKLAKDIDFYMYQYKTVYCPFNHHHDKSSCEYAHNVQDFRRNPLRAHYKAEICKNWNISSEITTYTQGGCFKNEQCDRCHGWKEFEYHPLFYKTRQCTNGKNCTRGDCGYYHANKDRRFVNRANKRENERNKDISKSSVKENSCRVNIANNQKNNSKNIFPKLLKKNSENFYKKTEKGLSTESGNFNIGFTPSNTTNTSLSKERRCLNSSSKDILTFTDLTEKNGIDFLQMRTLRKQSEGVRGCKDLEIFCLRSVDSNTTSSFNLNQFISPLKLHKEFGPKDELGPAGDKTTRTCPVSPQFENEQ